MPGLVFVLVIAMFVLIVALIPKEESWPIFTEHDRTLCHIALGFWAAMMFGGMLLTANTSGWPHDAGYVSGGVGLGGLVFTVAGYARLEYWSARESRTNNARSARRTRAASRPSSVAQ